MTRLTLLLGLGLCPGMLGSSILSAASLTRGPYLQTGTQTNIVVRWRTSEAVESLVRFGLNLNDLNRSVLDSTLKREHAVLLSGLSPNTKYFYSVGTVEGTFASGPNHYFITAPAQAKPTRIWAIGDCGTGAVAGQNGWRQVRDAYYGYTGNRETDVWLMLGDNAYYSGTDAEYTRAVFGAYQSLLTRTVLWSTIGNHETYAPVPLGDVVPYFNIFSLPTQGQAGGVPSGTENYYSFDYANIHFVCLDSELSSRATGGPMLAWLEEDLALNTNDWLIAFWHSPPYTKGSHNSDTEFNLADIRERFLPVLENYGVDLVLNGHSHNYERSYLLDGHYGYSADFNDSMVKDSGSGRPEESGPYLKSHTGPNPHQGAVYVIAGSSGWATFLQPDGPHRAMFKTLLKLGSMVIDVDGNRLDAKFLRETGAIDDHFTIIKGSPAEPVRIAAFRLREGVVFAQWKSKPGRTYVVEQTISLMNPDWIKVSVPIPATGATTFWSGLAEPELDDAFFRVVELP